MEFLIGKNLLTVEAYEKGIIKIVMTKADDTGPKSPALKLLPCDRKPAPDFLEGGDLAKLRAETLTLTVDRKNRRLEWFDQADSALVKRPLPEISRQEVML